MWRCQRCFQSVYLHHRETKMHSHSPLSRDKIRTSSQMRSSAVGLACLVAIGSIVIASVAACGTTSPAHFATPGSDLDTAGGANAEAARSWSVSYTVSGRQILQN